MNKHKNSVLCFFADLCLTLFGLVGTVFCVITAFDIQISNFALIPVCVSASFAFTPLFMIAKPHVRITAASAAAVIIAVSAWFCRHMLYIGAKTAISWIFIRYSRFVGAIKPFYTYDELTGGVHSGECTLFFIFFAIAFAFVLAFFVTRTKTLIPEFLLTVPFLVMCMFIVNTTPDMIPFVMLVTFWIILLFTGFIRKSDRGQASKAILILTPVMASALVLMILIFPQSSYKRARFINDLNKLILDKYDISTTVDVPDGQGDPVGEVSGENTSGSDISGSDESVEIPESAEEPSDESDDTSGEPRVSEGYYASPVDLSKLDSIKFTDKTLLKLKTIYSKNFLLRAFSSGDYSGNTWLPTDDGFAEASMELIDKYYTEKRITSQEFITEAIKHSDVTFTYFWANIGCYDQGNPLIYTPQYPVSKPEFIPTDSCYFHTSSASDSSYNYTVDFLSYKGSYTGLSVPDSLKEYESEYRALAYEYFLNVPDSCQNSVRRAASAAGVTDDMTIDEKIKAVESYVENCAAYTLSVSPLPAGTDFVTYFLDVSKKGFCMHFSTAATLIFRQLGIPARYVSGFYVDHSKKAKSGWIDITDRQAHAWVEVYCDGVGWIAVNVTPGYTTAQDDQGETEISAPDESNAEESEESSAISDVSLEISEVIPPESSSFNGKTTVIVCVLIALIAASAVIRRYSMIQLRRRRFDGRSNNKSVISMWLYIEALLRDAPPEDAVLGIAEKAKFSQHIVTDAEKKKVLDYTVKLSKAVYSGKSFLGKLAMKYIFALY